ncbi:MAG: glycoside hydrolase family 38 C-terminal domain-containing protein [Microthrixaceae bacterium]
MDRAEHEKYLSMDFPLRVRAESAACEVQFGKVDRPTHANTSWDAAKFEVCAHRWVDLSEPGFGVAVLNDGRYGHSLQGGGIRVSLLRAPSYPDPSADRGHHSVTLALLPHGPDRCDVLREAEALNQPLRFRPRAAAADGAAQGPTEGPVVGVGDERVGVSAVKLADDGSGDLIVRVWESVGDHVTTELTSSTPIGSVRRCNLLEESEADGHPLVSDGTARLELEPFQLLTIRLRRASSAPARSPATS